MTKNASTRFSALTACRVRRKPSSGIRHYAPTLAALASGCRYFFFRDGLMFFRCLRTAAATVLATPTPTATAATTGRLTCIICPPSPSYAPVTDPALVESVGLTRLLATLLAQVRNFAISRPWTASA